MKIQFPVRFQCRWHSTWGLSIAYAHTPDQIRNQINQMFSSRSDSNQINQSIPEGSELQFIFACFHSFKKSCSQMFSSSIVLFQSRNRSRNQSYDMLLGIYLTSSTYAIFFSGTQIWIFEFLKMFLRFGQNFVQNCYIFSDAN